MLPLPQISQMLGAFIAKEASKVVTPYLAKSENPQLLVAIPSVIALDNLISPKTPHQFSDPLREQLHKDCANGNLFDSKTIPAVNKHLDKLGVPLSKEAYQALKDDIVHTKQMSFSDPVPKKIADYRQKAFNQYKISSEFSRLGEHEGALLHRGYAGGLTLRATLYEYGAAPLENKIRMSMNRGTETE